MIIVFGQFFTQLINVFLIENLKITLNWMELSCTITFPCLTYKRFTAKRVKMYFRRTVFKITPLGRCWWDFSFFYFIYSLPICENRFHQPPNCVFIRETVIFTKKNSWHYLIPETLRTVPSRSLSYPGPGGEQASVWRSRWVKLNTHCFGNKFK